MERTDKTCQLHSCMYAHVHTHTHTNTYKYTHTHTHTHIQIHTHMYTHTHTHTNTHIHMHTHTHTHTQSHSVYHSSDGSTEHTVSKVASRSSLLLRTHTRTVRTSIQSQITMTSCQHLLTVQYAMPVCHCQTDVVDAHCYFVSIGRIDREQIMAESITMIAGRLGHEGLCKHWPMVLYDEECVRK